MRKMIYQKTYHLCVAKTEIQDDSEYRWYYGDDSDMDGNYKEFNTFDEFWVWAGDGNRPFFHGDVTQWHSIFSDKKRWIRVGFTKVTNVTPENFRGAVLHESYDEVVAPTMEELRRHLSADDLCGYLYDKFMEVKERRENCYGD